MWLGNILGESSRIWRWTKNSSFENKRHRFGTKPHSIVKRRLHFTVKPLLHPVVRGTTSGLRAKNGPSSEMHTSGKCFFCWSQTRRVARSLKTGRPVFRCDLAATISTPGARSEYARQRHAWQLGTRPHDLKPRTTGCKRAFRLIQCQFRSILVFNFWKNQNWKKTTGPSTRCNFFFNKNMVK